MREDDLCFYSGVLYGFSFAMGLAVMKRALNLCGFGNIQVSLWSFGSSSVQISNSSVLSVNNGSISSNYWHGLAASLKLVAIDENGNDLANFRLDKIPELYFNIDGNAGEILSSVGNITITNCGSIKTVKTSQGDIEIKQCQDIENIRSSQGSIRIDSCETVGSTRTSQGSINVRSRSQTR